MFADVLRHQTIQEALYFHRAIQDALLDAVEQAGAEAAVTPAMVIAAIYMVGASGSYVCICIRGMRVWVPQGNACECLRGMSVGASGARECVCIRGR